MAVYKVIQDIESEDKLLGPLSFKQFSYAAITIICGFINFQIIVHTGAGPLRWIPFLIILLPMIFFGVLAAPLGGQQPTEVWVLAKIRFYVKPRKRLWDQSGIKELVTITVPKKVVHTYTDGLSQTEVRSRLRALSTTLDSRGWAVKNVNVNMFTQPSYLSADEQSSDRLLSSSVLPQTVPTIDVRPEDDILDESTNATAQHLDSLMRTATEATHQHALDTFNEAREHSKVADPKTQNNPDFWFMHENSVDTTKKSASKLPKHGIKDLAGGAPVDPLYTFGGTVVRPGEEQAPAIVIDPEVVASRNAISEADEQALLEKVRHDKEEEKKYEIRSERAGHKRIPTRKERLEMERREAAEAKKKEEEMTTEQRAAILELAQNDDFSVATIQKEAKRKIEKPKDDGEVIFSRH